MSTTFVVSATPPAMKEVLTAMRPYTRDVNLITRTSFSPGEPVLFFIGVYSTFANPVSGTVRFQVFTSSGLPALDVPSNFTFTPGMTIGYVGISTSTAIAADTYTFTTTVTGGGASSTNSTTFAFAGPPVPTVSSSIQASVQADSGKAFFITEGQGKFPVTIHTFSMNDAEESLKQR
jgi:hypothetical protein